MKLYSWSRIAKYMFVRQWLLSRKLSKIGILNERRYFEFHSQFSELSESLSVLSFISYMAVCFFIFLEDGKSNLDFHIIFLQEKGILVHNIQKLFLRIKIRKSPQPLFQKISLEDNSFPWRKTSFSELRLTLCPCLILFYLYSVHPLINLKGTILGMQYQSWFWWLLKKNSQKP